MSNKSRFLIITFLAVIVFCENIPAAIIVDFSPDTTGAPLGLPNNSNQLAVQITGDRFTLAAGATLTGGSIFSTSTLGSLGDAVNFMVFADVAGTPQGVPMVNISTVLDAVDMILTDTQPTLTRKHATIFSTFLAAGTYWFSMPGNGVQIAQALTTSAGGYDDGGFRRGTINLAVPVATGGDMYFTLEGTAAAVPEPSTLLLLAFILVWLGVGVRRRSRKEF